MLKVQKELNNIGYVALKETSNKGIGIYNIKSGEKVILLSGDELIENNTPEKTWELIKNKLNV